MPAPRIFGALATILILAPVLGAQEAVPDNLRLRADAAEMAGDFEKALRLYSRLVETDRSPELRDHLRTCLRLALQGKRLRDPEFAKHLQRLSLAESLDLYAELVDRLSQTYAERARALVEHLFRAGLDEMFRAVDDPRFRAAHLRGVSDAAIHKFRVAVREATDERDVSTPTRARERLAAVAQAVRFQLGARDAQGAVVLEFVCGACHALDEYTTFLPGPVLAREMVSNLGRSVSDVRPYKGDVGALRISHFSDATPSEFEAAVEQLKQMSGGALKGLLIDLRGNPGGSLEGAVGVARRLLPIGVVVATAGQLPEATRTFESQSGMLAYDFPVVLLIDGRSASAAEVLAAALRDHGRATLIGATTYGKGSLQCILRLRSADASADVEPALSKSGGIRVTLAKLFAPGGAPISGLGVAPHIPESDPARQLALGLDHLAAGMMLLP